MKDSKKDTQLADSDDSIESGDENKKRGNWTNPLDFVLSLVGYAVGLSNIWRFPYLCMRNGGGAFLIPYFLFLFLCGLPLFYLEVSLGQFSSLSALNIWKICPIFKGVGWGMVIVSGITCMYYNTIIAWTIYYLVRSFTGHLPWESCDNEWNTPNCLVRSSNTSSFFRKSINDSSTDIEDDLNNSSTKWRTPTEEFWQFEVLELSDGIHEMGIVRWELALCLGAGWLLVFLCLFKGVKSLGKVVYVTATAPYVFLIILCIRGMTLEGSLEGIKYYIVPDFNRLLEFKVWSDACLQIFYTLGPAWGGLITMASFNKFHNNALRDSIVVSLVCCGTSFFAGFVIFSIIGFMAYEANLPVTDVITSGPGLAFIAYPEALSKLPISPMWAIFFFLMLLTVGLDSQFATFETVLSGFADQFPKYLQKHKTIFTGFACSLAFLIGLPFVCRGGMYYFQIVDWYAASFSCMVIALCELVCVCYIYGIKRFSYDIQMMAGKGPHIIFKILWCGVTPLLVLVMIIFTAIQMTPPTYGEYVYPSWAIGMGWGLAMCSIVPIPLYAIYLLAATKGSFLQRLKKCIISNNWEPAVEKYKIQYKYSPLYLTGKCSTHMDPLVDKNLNDENLSKSLA